MLGNHPQEELAKLARKVEKFKESYYILATCWNLLSKKNMQISELSCSDDIGNIFPTKILCTSLHSISFVTK
jgi:hypothetical protein